MKNSLNYFIVLLISVFTACSDKDNGGPDGNGGGSTNSYWPLKIGNQWNLINPDDNTDKMDYYVHKTVEHDGKTYYKFKPIGVEDDGLEYGVREDNGVFYELHGETSLNGVTTSAGTIISMNTNLNVGQVWKDEVTLNISGIEPGTLKHVNEGKILDKVDNVIVNGKSYKNVVKSEVKKSITNSLTGYTTVITYEFWLSKGVGLIYEKTTFSESNQVSYGLVDYVLK